MEFAGIIAPPRMGLPEYSMPFATRSFRRFPVPLCHFVGFCLLITLLVLSRGQACAEWVPVASNDERGVTTYVDSDTISHKGYLVKLWPLFNWETLEPRRATRICLARSKYNSTVRKSASDCLRSLYSQAIWGAVT
jgi:hypothetical protein